jgi:hypothetical protein
MYHQISIGRTRLPIRNPQANYLRFVDEIRIGIRRSKRSTHSRINY